MIISTQTINKLGILVDKLPKPDELSLEGISQILPPTLEDKPASAVL